MRIFVLILVWIVYLLITMSMIINTFWELTNAWYQPFFLNITGCLVAALGIGIYLVAALKFGSLKKLSGTGNAELETQGIYTYTRNPQFIGWWVFLFGMLVSYINFLSLMFLVVAIVLGYIQIFYEENNLRLKFGSQYFEYMKNVPRII